MKRFLSLAAMAAAIVAFVATTPMSPVLHGPIVTSVEGSRASGDLLLVELSGNPVVVTGQVEADGEVHEIPDGQAALLVTLKVSARDVPSPVEVYLVIDGSTYASDARLEPLTSFSTTSVAPGLWSLGTVGFRVPADIFSTSPEIRVEVTNSSFDALTLVEVVSLPLLGERIEMDSAVVPDLEVVGTWGG